MFSYLCSALVLLMRTVGTSLGITCPKKANGKTVNEEPIIMTKSEDFTVYGAW